MKIEDMRQHFLARAPWVDPQRTIDQIRLGEGDREVHAIGTGWCACAANLHAAAADGCDLFVSHEAPFACDTGADAGRDTPWGRRRAQICTEADMALMNLHDTWDHWPTYGVRDSWSAFLGLGEPLRILDYIHPGQTVAAHGRASLALHEVPATTADAFARHVARRVREIGRENVTLLGQPDVRVRTVATGVGCHIPSFEAREAGADLLVVVYDRALQTTVRLPLAELGAAVVTVEHGTAEMPAMRNLARYITETFGDLEATFYAREPVSRLIRPTAGG